MTRRVISFIVLLCFGLFSVETVVADVHDGDATASEIAQATAAQDVSGAQPESESGDPAQGTTSHEVHVCHCIHAHGGLKAMVVTLSSPEQLHDLAANLVVVAPAKVDRDVHVRPPIA